ncbi:MAG: DUF2336 domain-containing protein [Pseudorhodoplanes sp.]|nr:DUF2336 domain-containing protein [Pseudorhodoplanes sp.]
MSAYPSLIPELETALLQGSAEKHGEILRQITTLFLEGSKNFNEDHIRLFDDVFGRLIEEIEGRAKAELSRRLAPIANAPIEILRRLANDEDIAVAAPVLTQSPRLQEKDLVDIARNKGQAHLAALSERNPLMPAVTDILVQRGDRDVVQKVADNPGARLSEAGYSSLVRRAQNDGDLAASVAHRADIPDHLFRELLMRATEVVQRRLLAAAKPETQAEIRRVLAKVSGEVAASIHPKRNFSAAQETVRAAAASGTLDETMVAGFASAGRYEETVAALAALCDVPLDVIDKMMNGERPDPVLILCKSINFSWPTVRTVILVRPGSRGKSAPALDQASANFDKLSALTAQRVARFWQTTNTV